MTLEQIKDHLDTRNIVAAIQYAEPQRWSVNMVRVGHQQRVIMATCNGKVVREQLLEGRERLGDVLLLFQWRREFRCDGFEGEE